NFLLAIVLYAFLLMTVGERVVPARVDAVTPQSPAAAAGFRVGDVVVEADGRKVENFFELKQIVALRTGVPINFVVERGDQELVRTATPERRAMSDQLGGEQKLGFLGLQNSQRASDMVVKRYGPVEALAGGAQRTWEVLDTTLFYLGRVITGRENADQLGGPLRIAQTSGEVAKVASEGVTSLGPMLL